MIQTLLKIILIGTIFYAFPTSSHGQKIVIAGKVTNSRTGIPIPGVHIHLVDHQMVVLSDSLGVFRATIPDSETIKLLLTHVGYGQEIFRYSPGQELNLSLSPSNTELNHIVQVTASRYQQQALIESRSFTILNQKEIFFSASRTTPELLTNTAGIWMQKTNHGGGSPIIRGVTGNQVVLMTDGIRMNNAIYRYGPNQYLSTIEFSTLENIEVVRGTSSLLYGSDAIGGIVQLFTKKPEFNSLNNKFQFSGNLSSRIMTSRMQEGGTLQLEGGNQNFSFTSSLSYQQFGNLVAGNGIGRQSPSGYGQVSGNIKTAFRLNNRDLLFISHQNLTQRQVPRFDQVNLGGYSRYEFDPQSQTISFLRWQHINQNRLVEKITSTLYFNTLNEGLLTQKSGSNIQSSLKDLVRTTGLNLEMLSNPIKKWTTQYGFELFKDIVSSKTEKRFLSTGLKESIRGNYADGSTIESVSLFSNHQIELRQLRINGGVRYTGNKIIIPDIGFGNQKFTPSALVYGGGIGWKAGKNLFPYASVQTGFRAPNIDDLSKLGTVEAGIFEIPTNNLKPERSLGLETGVKFASRQSAFNVSLYQTSLQDLIDRAPALYLGLPDYENRKVFRKENVGEAIFRGIEIEYEFSLTKGLRAKGHFTYTHGENKTKEEPARRIPPAFGQFGLHYSINQNGNLSLVWNKAGSQFRLSQGDLSDKRISTRLKDGMMPGWETIDLLAGYVFGAIKIQVAFRNLLNKAYRIYGSGVDGYGRHASITAQWSF